MICGATGNEVSTRSSASVAGGEQRRSGAAARRTCSSENRGFSLRSRQNVLFLSSLKPPSLSPSSPAASYVIFSIVSAVSFRSKPVSSVSGEFCRYGNAVSAAAAAAAAVARSSTRIIGTSGFGVSSIDSPPLDRS